MKRATVILFCVLVLVIVGCGNKNSKKMDVIPETGVSWNASPSELEKMHGGSTDSYDTTDGGTTYCFNYNFQGVDGEFRYCYDEDNKEIVSALFFVRMDNEQDKFNGILDATIKQYTEELGNANYNFENEVAKSTGWLDKDKNVPLMIMAVNMPLMDNMVNTMAVTWYNPNRYDDAAVKQN